MLVSCVVVGIIVATATETSIYYVNTDESAVQYRDLEYEVAKLGFRDRGEVQVSRGNPGLPPKARAYRCGFNNLYATLTGVY